MEAVSNHRHDTAMNYIKFHCIYCGQHMEAETRFALRQLQCPACNARIAIPAAVKAKAGQRLQPPETWDTLVPHPEVSLPTRHEPALR
jgi:DNA-directed RNA polymerase subunit RPC12/RpoP